MYRPDCRKCMNCYKYGCRRIYGDDPTKATQTCAADGFKEYRFRPREKKRNGVHHGGR